MVRRRFGHAANRSFDCRPAVVLLPFGRESYLPAIVAAAGGVELGMGEETDRIVYQLERTSTPTTLVYSGMGGPAVANALEMIAGNGGRRVVVFGACGGAAPAIAVGDLVVATAGVRGDGVSRYYAPDGYPAVCAPDLTAALWDRAQASGVTSHRGIVFSTDASYRQGSEVYESGDGLVVAVDCECAPAAVVGARLGISVGCLLFCTDNVTLEDRADRDYRGLADPRVRRGFEGGLAAALAALEESDSAST